MSGITSPSRFLLLEKLLAPFSCLILSFSFLSQMSYLLVVILELNDVSKVQYKKIMIIGNE